MNYARFKAVFLDLYQGFKSWRIWLLLGFEDIQLRYRRSTLGPFWLTLSMAAMIYSLGFVYGQLFELDLSTYYPFIATGIVTWYFIASVINDATDVFTSSSEYIQQIKLPYSVYILRMLINNLIVFFHNFLAILPIFIFLDVGITPLSFLVFLFNLVLLLICGFCYSFIISLFGTRFRDIKPIFSSLLQIFFLLTPILWMPSMLPERFIYLADYNIFYHMVHMLRLPLLGQIPSLVSYGYIIALILVGFVIMLFLLCRTRHRIAFWL